MGSNSKSKCPSTFLIILEIYSLADYDKKLVSSLTSAPLKLLKPINLTPY